MRSLPTLTRDGDFIIEKVTRHSDPNLSFRVSLRLANGEHRSFLVSAEVLFEFDAFRIAALEGANVFLRHEAEERNPEGQQSWLDLIDEAISQSEDETERRLPPR